MRRLLGGLVLLTSVIAAYACGLQTGGSAIPREDATPPPMEGGSSCDASVCGTACVDLSNDSKNCGACGNDCAVDGTASTCKAGKCVSCAGIDFTADAKHCGRCGHDCLGGACVAGKCQPAVLAITPTVKATMIAVEGGFVFWIGEAIDFGPKKGIYRAPINASSFAGDLILGNVTLLLDVAVASGTVYFSTFSQVGFVGADGGASTKIADTNYSYVVSASNNGVFWTNYFASYPTVLRADLDGGNIGLVANTGATAFPHGVFSDNSGTFWVENTRVMRTDGDAGTILATPLVGRNGQIPGIRRVTADNSRVYWTEPSVGPGTASGRVASIAKDGSEDAGAPVVLAASQVEPRVLTLDNTYVYWTDFGSGSGTGSVMRARKDGSQAAETLVTNLDQPLGITNDANAIYFALYTDPGKILRLAK